MNDENILVPGDPEDKDPLTVERESRVGAFAQAEIDRIFTTFGEPV